MRFAAFGIAWLLILCTPVAAEDVASETPAASENDHQCQRYYPPRLIRTGVEGETTIGFNVSVDGKVKNLHIVISSGYPELDQSSLLCATGWTYKPKILKGEPVEVPEQAIVKWMLSGAPVGGVGNPGNSLPLLERSAVNPCDNYSRPVLSDPDEGKNTTVQYVVKADGHVEDAFVAKSSGDPAFDAMAVECVSRLLYHPGIENGRPVDREWGTVISRIPHVGLLDLDGTGTLHVCRDNIYPYSENAARKEGTTSISFHVVYPGTVGALQVDQSSGDPTLDRAAFKCASQWKYPGVEFDPQHSDISQTAKIFWKDGHAFVLEFAIINCISNSPNPICKK